MRCPKCHYISFDSTDRCRNCGYEFSLSVDVASLDLPIQTGDEPLGPLRDFALSELDISPSPAAEPAVPFVDAEPIRTASDLPLFENRGPNDDRPLVTPPAVPRAPLAVRRSTPIVQRPAHRRAAADEPVLDLALEEPGPAPEPAPAPQGPGVDAAAAASYRETASAGARLFGGVVDLLIIGSIDAAVLYLTLRICGLQPGEIAIIPPIPFIVFLLMLNGGYFIGFTVAGGQTIGKMAASTRVVPAGDESWSDRVPLPQATVRTAAYFVSLLPAGAGFVPALLGGERKTLPDRLADTRVVKA